MYPLHPFFSILIYLVAFLTAYLIQLKFKATSLNGRYETIDGMRGFLALGVFIHHTSIWHQYLQTGIWAPPNSNLYNQFGQTSVSLFFMITSFLFVSKLLNSKEKGFSFRDFFISRIFRLAPMYYFSLAIIIVIIMVVSHWQLQVDIITFIKSIFHWGTFSITGMPEINNYGFTNFIDAGVIWSLPYEWLFYFSLPLMALCLKIIPEKKYLILSVLFLILFYNVHSIIVYHLLSFVGGAIAAFLLKYTSVHTKVKNSYSSIVILICLLLVGQFSTANNVICIALITIIFNLVAMGNSVFGILKSDTLKFLGEICYSTYLLHGIILFSFFYFGIGFEAGKQLSPVHYCIAILCISPLVVVISFLGFKYIEKPFMDKSKKVIAKRKS